MNTKFWIPTLVSLALATGTVESFADNGWYYDEGTDTIVHSYTGDPVILTNSPSEEQPTGNWNYDEGSDSIVFNGEGSRDMYITSGGSRHTFEFDYNLAFLDQ